MASILPKPIQQPVPQAAPLPDQVPVEQPPEPPPLEPNPTEEAPEKTAIEQDASLTEEKGVLAEAQPFKAISPIYPRISRRRGEEGTISLSIEVLKSGKAGAISVIKTSGYKRLDEAAINAAQKTRFVPATQFGKKINSTMRLSYAFRLTNEL